MMRLKKCIMTFMLIIKYCITHKRPFFVTFYKFVKLWKEEQVSFRFLIETDYLSHPDSFCLPASYVNKCRKLNSEEACDLLDNKTVLYKRCPELLGRECLILKECSEQEKLDFIKRHSRFVGKRNYGCFGRQFAAYDTTLLTMEEIMNGIRDNRQVLLEEYIIQHDVIMAIYPHAVNTLRIHTVSNGKEIRSFLKPKLRIGCDNSIMDVNSGKGSYHIVLNLDGTVCMAAYLHSSGKIEKAVKHHNTNVFFDQLKLPYVQEAVDLARKAAGYFPEIPYIGWDIAITSEGPVVVEGNGISGAMGTYQMIQNLYHGTGLKREIDEMLDFGISNKE